MKNKYQRLPKEDKLECKKMYYNTLKGKQMHLRLFRLLILGTLGILFSSYILINGFIHNNIRWYDYLMSVPLFFISIVFIIGSLTIKNKVLNQFALKIPKFKNKKV